MPVQDSGAIGSRNPLELALIFCSSFFHELQWILRDLRRNKTVFLSRAVRVFGANYVLRRIDLGLPEIWLGKMKDGPISQGPRGWNC